jgi:ABC-type lipoprotein export system ATPase subunit
MPPTTTDPGIHSRPALRIPTVEPMPVVTARGLVRTFGEGRGARRVLDGTALDVEAGEVVAVLGRSGSGKSTLLHVLGGLDRPEAGVVEVAGERVTGASERDLSALRRRRIGFVFQFFHLLPELSGEANVLLAGRVRGARPDAAARGRGLIDRLGLGPVAGSLPHQLSGGEQQRFAIARALVNDPALLLADEPTGNLDVEAGAAVLALLRELADEGRAVVLVTHEASAAAIADRVLRLQDGVLVPA